MKVWGYCWTDFYKMSCFSIMYLIYFIQTVKLVKISLAMFYSTLKHKKQFDDHERIQAQKRAEIVNFIISLVERGN
jgi:hypothetical protein